MGQIARVTRFALLLGALRRIHIIVFGLVAFQRSKKLRQRGNELNEIVMQDCCDYRIVHCEVCQGEGRILRSRGGPDEVDLGQCWHCDGTGHAVIKVYPIEMEDLDEKHQQV
jgi:hypothetical protein